MIPRPKKHQKIVARPFAPFPIYGQIKIRAVLVDTKFRAAFAETMGLSAPQIWRSNFCGLT